MMMMNLMSHQVDLGQLLLLVSSWQVTLWVGYCYLEHFHIDQAFGQGQLCPIHCCFLANLKLAPL